MTSTALPSSPAKPEPALLPSHHGTTQTEAPLSDVDLEKADRSTSPNSEFDPCSNAHFTSPFYNHDTPRVSSDYVNNKHKGGPLVELYVLPTQASSTSTLKKKKQPCLTKPVQRSRFWARLSKKQKLAVKLLLAFLLCGAIVGLAVGISKSVGGGVVKNDNQVTNIS